jgi:hypothetical protein
MKFWDHTFRKFGEVERICMTCGYVTPAPATEQEVKDWMRQHNGAEWWCGGAWHHFDVRPADTDSDGG